MVGATPAPAAQDNPFGKEHSSSMLCMRNIPHQRDHIMLHLYHICYCCADRLSSCTCDFVFPCPNFNIFNVQMSRPYNCSIGYSAGAVHSIVKDFRENHTDTTVLFTVTVVPGDGLF